MDITDIFQGPGDWKQTQEANMTGPQDPAAMFRGRQGILTRTLIRAQDELRIATKSKQTCKVCS